MDKLLASGVTANFSPKEDWEGRMVNLKGKVHILYFLFRAVQMLVAVPGGLVVQVVERDGKYQSFNLASPGKLDS